MSTTNLLEMITQLDDRRGLKHPLIVDDELPVLQRVDVALDQEEIGAALDRQETFTRNVDPVGVLEMFDSCSSGSLELKKKT